MKKLLVVAALLMPFPVFAQSNVPRVFQNVCPPCEQPAKIIPTTVPVANQIKIGTPFKVAVDVGKTGLSLVKLYITSYGLFPEPGDVIGQKSLTALVQLPSTLRNKPWTAVFNQPQIWDEPYNFPPGYYTYWVGLVDTNGLEVPYATGVLLQIVQ